MRRSTTSNDGWFWTNLRIYTPFRALAVGITAATLTVGCGREGGMAREVGKLNYDFAGAPKTKKRELTPTELAAESASQVGALLSRQRTRDLTPKQQQRLHAGVQRLDKRLASLQSQFAADRKKLTELDADAGLGRLAEIERRTAEAATKFRAALDALASDGRKDAGAVEGVRALAELFPAAPEQATSSNLSFGAKNADPQTVPTSAGITPAYGAPTAAATPSSLPASPSPDDLAATDGTAISEPIRSKADALDRDPVKIFRFVYNTIAFEPYAGVRKGPEQTLAEKSGSDADQATLLVALLRASGVHSRFVRGVAELPAAKVASMLGIDTANGEKVQAAPDILASGGIPTTQVRIDGQLARVKFDHLWVEAYLPADAYRGVDENAGAKRWLALDPSIKAMKITAADEADEIDEELQDRIRTKVQLFASQAQTLPSGGHQLPNGATIRQFADDMHEATKDVLDDHGAGVGEDRAKVFGSTSIVPLDTPYIPASLPFRTVAVSSETRGVPASLWSQIRIDVGGALANKTPDYNPERDSDDGFTFSAPTYDLANKRITLGYAPATDDDAAIIDSYHGLLNTPSYAAALIPVLRVDGVVVARGHRPAPVAYWQNYRISYRSPGFAADVVENPVAVGSMSVLSLNLGRKSRTQVDDRAKRLSQVAKTATAGNVMTDERVGELLALAGDTYFALNDQQNTSLAATWGVDARRAVSGAIVSTKLRTLTVAGFPVATSLSGFNIDVDQDVQAITPVTNDPDAVDRYLTASATTASLSESQTFNLLFQARAVSTTNLMARAMTAGIPIYEVTSGNVDAVAPLLTQSASVVAQVRQAVADGATVTIPRDPVTVNVWVGTGYVVKDGTSLAFQISGGTSGGDTGPQLGPFPTSIFNPHFPDDPNFNPNRTLDLGGLAAWMVARLAEIAGVPPGFTACLELIIQLVETIMFPTDGKSLVLRAMEVSTPLAGWLVFALECVMALNEILQTINTYNVCGDALGETAGWFMYGDV